MLKHLSKFILLLLLISITAIAAEPPKRSVVFLNRYQADWFTVSDKGELKVHLYFFWSRTCPHCHAALPFIEKLQQTFPWLELHSHELTTSPENVKMYNDIAAQVGEKAGGVPAFAFCEQMQVGYGSEEDSGAFLKKLLESCYNKKKAEQANKSTDQSTPSKEVATPSPATNNASGGTGTSGSEGPSSVTPQSAPAATTPGTSSAPPAGTPQSAPAATTPGTSSAPPAGTPQSAPAATTPGTSSAPPAGTPQSAPAATTPGTSSTPPAGTPQSAPAATTPGTSSAPPAGTPQSAPTTTTPGTSSAPPATTPQSVPATTPSTPRSSTDSSIDSSQNTVHTTPVASTVASPPPTVESQAVTAGSQTAATPPSPPSTGAQTPSGVSNPPSPPPKIETVTTETPTQQQTATSKNKPIQPLPVLGEIDPKRFSLPLYTLIIAGLDAFNPCAFFILLFLLSLLVHTRSRFRMLLIGGIFVFFSGFIYFLFMAAWLNMFLWLDTLQVVTIIAGTIAVVIALINIKDFFWFKEGVSLSIPDAAKPDLYQRIRGLVQADSMTTMITSTVILAVVANAYELLCTAGFPMVYTRILTMNDVVESTGQYYWYLALYNIVYVVPLIIIVLVFTYTLGSRKLGESEGRTLKLLSGLMMLGLGLVILFKPELLTSITAATSILLGAVVGTFVLSIIHKKLSRTHNSSQRAV